MALMLKFAAALCLPLVLTCAPTAPADPAVPVHAEPIAIAQAPAVLEDSAPRRCDPDPCFLCPPPSGLCRITGCAAPDEDGNVCVDNQAAPGQGCNDGRGLCNAAGDCVAPGGRCVRALVPWSRGCIQSRDCDDGNPCTEDTCQNSLGNGWCMHTRQSEGLMCAPGMVCRTGACCEPLP